MSEDTNQGRQAGGISHPRPHLSDLYVFSSVVVVVNPNLPKNAGTVTWYTYIYITSILFHMD
jgi:hypothetical protein